VNFGFEMMASLEEHTKIILAGKEKDKGLSKEIIEKASKRIIIQTLKDLDSCHEYLRALWTKISDSSTDKSTSLELLVAWTLLFFDNIIPLTSQLSVGSKDGIIKTIMYSLSNLHKVVGLDALFLIAQKACTLVSATEFTSFIQEQRHKVAMLLVQFVTIILGKVKKNSDVKSGIEEVRSLLQCAKISFTERFFAELKIGLTPAQFQQYFASYCESVLQTLSRLDDLKKPRPKFVETAWNDIFGLLAAFSSINMARIFECARKSTLVAKGKTSGIELPCLSSVDNFILSLSLASRVQGEIAQIVLWTVDVSATSQPALEDLLTRSPCSIQDSFIMSVRILLHLSGLNEIKPSIWDEKLIISSVRYLFEASDVSFELAVKLISLLISNSLKDHESIIDHIAASALVVNLAESAIMPFSGPSQRDQYDAVLAKLYISVLAHIKESVSAGGLVLRSISVLTSVLSAFHTQINGSSLSLAGAVGSCLTSIVSADRSQLVTDEFDRLDDVLYHILLDKTEASFCNNDAILATFLASQYSGIGKHERSLRWLTELSNKQMTKVLLFNY
jgi:hypothetical protein